MTWYKVTLEDRDPKYVVYQKQKPYFIEKVIQYPSICPCCNKKIVQLLNQLPIETEKVIDVAYYGNTERLKIRKFTYNFPMCGECYNHAKFWNYLKYIPSIIMASLLGIMVIGSLFLRPFENVIYLIIILGIGTFVLIFFVIKKTNENMSINCVSKIPIKGGKQGELYFENKVYAQQFTSLNNAHLDSGNILVEDNFDKPKQQFS